MTRHITPSKTRDKLALHDRPRLTVTLPDETALNSLANSLASLLARSNG